MEKLLSSTLSSPPPTFKKIPDTRRELPGHIRCRVACLDTGTPRHHPCRPCMGGWVPYLGPWEIHKVFPFLLGLEADLGVWESQGHV